MTIREISKNEIKTALKLVWEVFLEYESKSCSKEEIEDFKNRLNNQLWIDERKFYGAFENNEILGVIATKGKTHITLFYVDSKYHNKGIGRKLYDKIEKLNNKGFFTVISSTYAHDIYKHLGFIDIDKYSENKNFYPMKKILNIKND